MTTIVAISGSLRKASFNTSLLRVASELLPAGCQLEWFTLHGVPLYDAAHGIPEAVARLIDARVGALRIG